MRQRQALYDEVADFSVSTDGRRVQLVAEEIHKLLLGSAAPQ
jgi:shikimate kinase